MVPKVFEPLKFYCKYIYIIPKIRACSVAVVDRGTGSSSVNLMFSSTVSSSNDRFCQQKGYINKRLILSVIKTESPRISQIRPHFAASTCNKIKVFKTSDSIALYSVKHMLWDIIRTACYVVAQTELPLWANFNEEQQPLL